MLKIGRSRRRLTSLLSLLTLLVLVGCAPKSDAAEGVAEPFPSPGRNVLPTLSPGVAPAMAATAASTPTPLPPPTATLAPEARLEAAIEAERIGAWEIAMPLYESLRDHPEHGIEALFRVGDLYLRDDRLVEAGAAWRAALQRDPDGPLGAPLRYRLALGFASLGQHEVAVDLWQQYDELDDTIDDLVAGRLAASLEALGQRDEAAIQRERLYAFEGADRVARALAARSLADYHARAGRWDEALTWYERTLELSEVDSFRAELHLRLAGVAGEVGDPQYAINQWELLVEEYPGSPEALVAATELAEAGRPLDAFEIGELYFANERWSDAVRLFFSSLEAEDRPEAHEYAARALEQAGNHTAALTEWEKLLETHPEVPELHDDALLGIARAAIRLGDAERAVASWERIAREFPNSNAAPVALWERAEWLAARGEIEPAAAAYERLATRYPTDEGADDALWEAGILRYRAGDLDGARQSFAVLAALDSPLAEAGGYWAGKSAARQGDEADAAVLWRAAATRDPDSYYALRAADMLRSTGWAARPTGRATEPPIRTPDPALDWLTEASGERSARALLELPDDPRLERAATMLLVGERDAALDEYLEIIRAYREEPQPLWALTHELREQGLNSYSILAATRLMALLGYDATTVPPSLGALVYPIPFERELAASAAEWGVDPLFFAALIYQESRWEPRARSFAAARGLTQVIPATGQWIAQRLPDPAYSYRKLDRPVISLRYGGYYLDYVLGLFDQDPYRALASYNGGPGNASRWDTPDDDLFVENITLSETRLYVEEIYRHWHAYRRIYGGGE